jgi:hypothetical protein
MAPNNKSKVEDEAVANLSTGWHKTKMFEELYKNWRLWDFSRVKL